MNIGNWEFSKMLTPLRKLDGHLSGVPSGDSDQLKFRVCSPISPPPFRKGKVGQEVIVTGYPGLVWILNFTIQMPAPNSGNTIDRNQAERYSVKEEMDTLLLQLNS